MKHRIDKKTNELGNLEETMWQTTQQNQLANLIINERVRRARKTRRDNRGIR